MPLDFRLFYILVGAEHPPRRDKDASTAGGTWGPEKDESLRAGALAGGISLDFDVRW